MDSTAVVAALGLLTTLAAAGVTAYLQRSSQRESRVFEARVTGYAALAAALYEYERATYNRVKARLEQRSDTERDTYRQEAWASNAKARAAIGVVALLSTSPNLHAQFDDVRSSIGDLKSAPNEQDLSKSHESILRALEAALFKARQELLPARGRGHRR
ncbi:hypothetical protein [Intrasporangium calvum]|uniref:hypothetical protein n=1 Tax=Intrasporangium calvum TaxID=53358 RepID=UPI0011D1BE2B|nr:hypothetical protein [Intrasporangium calvum]